MRTSQLSVAAKVSLFYANYGLVQKFQKRAHFFDSFKMCRCPPDSSKSKGANMPICLDAWMLCNELRSYQFIV